MLKAKGWIRDKRQLDDKGNTLMTLDYLKQVCKEQDLYSTPYLNDRLYLHYKGFSEISESLGEYSGLKTIWLEGNGISKIEHLEQLKELRCLFLQQNCITEIENLDSLDKLDTLNLSQNLLKSLAPCLASLTLLTNFNISKNYLQSANGNPIVRDTHQYRRTVISRLLHLTYLDDKPVFPGERLAVEAFMKGGIDAEREERARQKQEEMDKNKRDFEALAKLQQDAREKRRRDFPDYKEDSVAPEVESFRLEMLDKIEETKKVDTIDVQEQNTALHESTLPLRNAGRTVAQAFDGTLPTSDEAKEHSLLENRPKSIDITDSINNLYLANDSYEQIDEMELPTESKTEKVKSVDITEAWVKSQKYDNKEMELNETPKIIELENETDNDQNAELFVKRKAHEDQK